MKKRGQVTVFIVLGIIILILVGLVIYFRSEITQTVSELGVFKAAVPSEVDVIQKHVDDCILETSSEAVNLIAQQGGYIDIPEDTIPVSIVNPFSNKLLIFPDGDFEVAYWYYKTANNIDKSAVPTIKSMESELSSYIKENLPSCFDFNQFPDHKVSYRDFDLDVSIKDDAVNVDVSMPISIVFKKRTYSLKRFAVKVPAPLGRLYETAKDIMDEENDNFFLEEKTIDILAVHDEIPFSETNFECKPEIWSKTNIKEALKSALSRNIPYIRVKGSDYGLNDQSHKYFEEDVGSMPSIPITFMYFSSWPLKMDVYPSDGELLESNQVLKKTGSDVFKFLASLFCLTDYNFVYDIQHPVLITLSDPRAFGNRGFSFNFATLVVVDKNQPRENLADIPESIPVDKQLCKYPLTLMTVSVSKYSGSGLIAVPDADISFKCISTICDIGRTDSSGTLVAYFPQCINGAVIVKKEGLSDAKAVVSTNEPSSVSLNLEPLFEKSLNIKVIDSSPRSPKNELVVFTLENLDNGYLTSVTSDDSSIVLSPGKYKISSYVLADSPFKIKIPAKDVEKCVDVPKGILGLFGATEKKCSSVTVPAVELEQTLKGGAVFEHEFTRQKLFSSSELTLYTMINKIPADYEQLANLYVNIDQNHLKNNFITPKLK